MLELEGTSASTFGAGKTETGRHDAHHDVALAVQQDRATEHPLCRRRTAVARGHGSR